MKKLLSIILLVAGVLLPMKLWAQDKVYEPYFQFEGDNLLMLCDTEGATIYYVIEPYSADMSEDEAYTFAESLQVNDQSAVYSNPIPISENVIIKAVAVKQGLASSDPATLIYNYLAWKELEKAILYGSDVLSRAQDNPNVDQSLKEDLQWRIEEGEHFYYERAWMDSHQAEHFSQEIMDIARQIEEQMGGGTTTAEPYAVLSDNNTVLTFYYDEHKAERNGMSVGPFTEEQDHTGDRGWIIDSGWDEQREHITNVVFDASFANCTTIISTAYWFFGFTNLNSITDISNLKTDNVTNMRAMFRNCSSLTSLDVSNFNTSNVTDMAEMFDSCSSLTSLDVSNFNTSKVTAMWVMFGECSSLTSLDVSHFDTSNVTGMGSMFIMCHSLTSLDVSNFNTSKVSYANAMFAECSSLESLDVSHFDTSKVPDMSNMFTGCYSLTSLDVSNFDTSSATTMSGMFAGCPNLASLDLSGFNTEKVTNMEYMFLGCSNLTTINVSNKWSTANVTSSEKMFNGCESLVGGAGTRYDANHTDISYAHIDGGENNPGYFTGVDNSLVAYFPFNGNANDESGHGNNGTPTEAVSLTTGVQGDANGAYQFGSVENSGHIYMPNSESLQIGDEWSFATYVKPLSSAGMDEWGIASDNGTHAIVGHSHDRTGFAIQYGINEERFHTYIGHLDGGWSDGISASADGNYLNKWIHIAYTYANNTFQIYINGKLITTTYTTPDFTDANTQDWYFGKYSDYWYPLNGILDEIRIYNRALNANEIVELAKYADKLEESGASFDGLTAWVSGDVPLEEAFMEVEGGREAAAQTIAAIVWENSYALTADMLQGISNPNLLVYVNEPSLAPQGIQNVVVNGQAQEIVLTDAATGNNNWYCPEAFTAEKISYTRNFGQQTEVGVSRGWESIALPFTVQEITHESKGQITPFGANGTKHFWLRGYSPDGLYSAATLEANKPYVISMPNNTVVYPDAYNLNGRVTFSAENTTVPATPPLEEMMVVRDNIIMMPTFQYIPQNEYVYAVNVGQARDRYAEGSVFARDLRDVRPFEAYTTHGERNGARPNFIRIAAQPNNESVGIRDIKTDSAEDAWYSIDGRKLQGEPQRKGVYIQKGKKVVR